MFEKKCFEKKNWEKNVWKKNFEKKTWSIVCSGWAIERLCKAIERLPNLEYVIDTFMIVQVSIDWHATDRSIVCPAQSVDIADRSFARDIYTSKTLWGS